MIEPGRRMFDQIFSERFRRFGGEKRGMRVRQFVELGLDRRHHFAVAVTETGYGRTAGGIDVPFALAVDQIGAIPGDSLRVVMGETAMNDAGHGDSWLEQPIRRSVVIVLLQHMQFCGKP